MASRKAAEAAPAVFSEDGIMPVDIGEADDQAPGTDPQDGDEATEETEPTIPKEDEMADKPTPEQALVGCPFDAITAQAVHGKNVILLVNDSEGDLVGIAGQQGLSWTIEGETTESPTKDGNGEWSLKFAGVKSWSASTDGLYCFDDPGRNKVIAALKKGTYLCAGMYKREQVDEGTKYVPVRKGIVIVTSDELDAPQDDNMTFSLNLEGTGECWMIETATPEDIEAGSFVTELPII